MKFCEWHGKTGYVTALALVTFFLLVPVAHAEKYKYKLGNHGKAVVVEQPNPNYPTEGLAKGQEGWVRMHYVVTADGRAIDPIVVDSCGGAQFEAEARKAIANWRFDAPASGGELPNNLVNIRTETQRGRNGATPNFTRYLREIVAAVNSNDLVSAQERVDHAHKIGGWNLYESVMLLLVAGRVDGAEGNMVGKLEHYRRALGVSNRDSLNRNGRRDALTKIFDLQDQYGHYAEATRTFRLLEKERDNRAEMREFGPRAAEIKALLASDDTVTAAATIYNPCDCDAGEPLWYYRPARRTFSFANLNGNVERFEARCDSMRIRGDVVEGKRWTLAPEWGNCRMFVFGDDRASFDFLEHPTGSEDESSGESAVARSHVLD